MNLKNDTARIVLGVCNLLFHYLLVTLHPICANHVRDVRVCAVVK